MIAAGIVSFVSVGLATTSVIAAHNARVSHSRESFLPGALVSLLDSDSDGLVTMRDPASVWAQVLTSSVALVVVSIAEWRHRGKRSA